MHLNRDYFAGSVPPLPTVIGTAAYGKCIGATLHPSAGFLGLPRITLAPEIFKHGTTLNVADTLLHEMIHAVLMLRWMLTELSPTVVGREVVAQPVVPRRGPNPDRGRWRAVAGTTRALPQCLRPVGYYSAGRRIDVLTY